MLNRLSRVSTILRPQLLGYMPQLTLGSGPSNSLALSPQKPTATAAAAARSHSSTSPNKAKARIASYTRKGDEPNLWELHHIQEDMALDKDKKRKREQKNEEEEMVGQPGKRREAQDEIKRGQEPQGGGVAGDGGKNRGKNAYEIKGKVATAEDAASADENPPLGQLETLVKQVQGVEKGDCVVYWMRMEDMRIDDNTALYKASQKARELGVPLVALFVFSPGDYKIHDRSRRRIDFMLRNLRDLKGKLDELNIPLELASYDRRLSIPRRLVTELFPSLGAKHIYVNIEYEVDELRRDIAVLKLAKVHGVEVRCVHDRLVVPPGKVKSQAGKPMSVFSPWQRAWARILDNDPAYLEESPLPQGNGAEVRKSGKFASLFEEPQMQIPDQIEGFECPDREKMAECWPEGTGAARELLDRFLYTKARKEQFHLISPLTDGAERDPKSSRVANYQTGRNLVDGDNSSRISPYLASGVISGRMVINAGKAYAKGKLQSGRDTGVGMWTQEVAWRDFYNHVMCTWPRVSMGRPFLEKFADVQWEVNEEHLQAWKDGKTGFPIVDAAMRACKARGWMENRVRMVSASFLVKSLMLDWRLGEKHFMENFIDGDLAANNGGWQWTASTGTDPQPYFRIFNTLTQSEKCDPNGDYIRYWVPELKNLKGKAVHDPYHTMPSIEFKKLGYPAPIVDHKKSRERALFRYKNVGEKEDGA